MGYARDSGAWVKTEAIEVRDAGKEIYVFCKRHTWKKCVISLAILPDQFLTLTAALLGPAKRSFNGNIGVS